MTKSYLSFEKALEMYRRDTNSGFGRDYIPAIPYFRYCAACAADEYRETGGSWWHVEHNLPGVLICIHHGVVLNDVSWNHVTNGWGGLPHHYTQETRSEFDTSFPLEFSRAINGFQRQRRRFCPFIVAMAAMESVVRIERCPRDELIDVFMDRFSNRFSPRMQAMIARHESVRPDRQVIRLLRDC